MNINRSQPADMISTTKVNESGSPRRLADKYDFISQHRISHFFFFFPKVVLVQNNFPPFVYIRVGQ